MDKREIIKELIENEMRRLEDADCARPIDYVGIDRYDSDEEKSAHSLGYEKYNQLKQIQEHLGVSKSRTKLSEIIPGWKEIVQELLEDEMRRLENADCARPNDYTGIDRYDSDEEKNARSAGFSKYQKIGSMMEKLVMDKKHSNQRNTLLSAVFPKKETSFLDER